MTYRDSDKWPDHGPASWPTWWNVRREETARFNRVVKKRVSDDLQWRWDQEAIQVCRWAMYRSLLEWQCRPCGKACSSRAELRILYYRRVVQGTTGKACRKPKGPKAAWLHIDTLFGASMP